MTRLISNFGLAKLRMSPCSRPEAAVHLDRRADDHAGEVFVFESH